MVSFLVQFCKASWHYIVQIGAGFLIFSALFFLYAKYKTGKNFKELSQLYFEMISKAGIITGVVLGVVAILTEYVPTCHIVIFLLGLSSLSILFKYVHVVQSKKTMATDVCIILANMYCSYLLLMQDRFVIKDYAVLAFMVFSISLYQQIKKLS